MAEGRGGALLRVRARRARCFCRCVRSAATSPPAGRCAAVCAARCGLPGGRKRRLGSGGGRRRTGSTCRCWGCWCCGTAPDGIPWVVPEVGSAVHQRDERHDHRAGEQQRSHGIAQFAVADRCAVVVEGSQQDSEHVVTAVSCFQSSISYVLAVKGRVVYPCSVLLDCSRALVSARGRPMKSRPALSAGRWRNIR